MHFLWTNLLNLQEGRESKKEEKKGVKKLKERKKLQTKVRKEETNQGKYLTDFYFIIYFF